MPCFCNDPPPVYGGTSEPHRSTKSRPYFVITTYENTIYSSSVKSSKAIAIISSFLHPMKTGKGFRGLMSTVLALPSTVRLLCTLPPSSHSNLTMVPSYPFRCFASLRLFRTTSESSHARRDRCLYWLLSLRTESR